MTPDPRHDYRIGVPVQGSWREVLNSDSDLYGGSNVGNFGELTAAPDLLHGRPASLSLTIPPLGLVILKPGASFDS
jgi:1,4-alpha-glucan branching enzyme